MEFARQISRMFHDEHLTNVATLERFEALLHAQRKKPPVDPASDGEIGRMLRELETLIASDVTAHFAFEEENLFPLLAEAGDVEMGALLAEEHRTILAVAEDLSGLSHAVLAGENSVENWRSLNRVGVEFTELMIAHIQKEEMGLLPVLDDTLDETRDAELVMEYSAAR